ncbi:MAG: hypothetical protein AB7J34_24725, partial [Limisphaerales bacterium]
MLASFAVLGVAVVALSVPRWLRRDNPTPAVPSDSRATPAASMPGQVVPPPRIQPQPDDDDVIRELVTTEETLLALARRLDLLSRGLLDLRLPGPSAEATGVFAPTVQVRDLAPEAPSEGSPPVVRYELSDWPLAEASPATAAGVQLWKPLLDRVASFDHARFTLLAGNHPNGSPLQFDSTARFDGLARMKSGEWRSIEASLTLSWELEASGDGPPGEWRIRAWTTESLRWNTTPRRHFSEV